MARNQSVLNTLWGVVRGESPRLVRKLVELEERVSRLEAGKDPEPAPIDWLHIRVDDRGWLWWGEREQQQLERPAYIMVDRYEDTLYVQGLPDRSDPYARIVMKDDARYFCKSHTLLERIGGLPEGWYRSFEGAPGALWFDLG